VIINDARRHAASDLFFLAQGKASGSGAGQRSAGRHNREFSLRNQQLLVRHGFNLVVPRCGTCSTSRVAIRGCSG
jgi:hypothetical protein